MPQLQEAFSVNNVAGVASTNMTTSASSASTNQIMNRIQQQNHQKMYARAIYDNIAESPDELAFKKGDILSVIEQDTDGIEGWWLCTLRGRQGMCPGNRLRIMPSYDPGCCSPSPISSPCPSSNYGTTSSMISVGSSIIGSDFYENIGTIQKYGKRRSYYGMGNKVITPQKYGDVYLYGGPYQNTPIMSDPDAYDIPKPAVHINYDTPRGWSRTPSRTDDSYDIPRPANLLSQQNLTPSSSNSSLLTDSLSLSSSNRSSLANMPDYDVPRKNPPSVRSTPPPPPQASTVQTSLSTATSVNSIQSTYDIPQGLSGNAGGSTPQPHSQKLLPQRDLPLELSSALETLAKLQNEATSAVTRLLAFVTPTWRTHDKLDPILMDLKLAAVRLRTALHDLAEFGDGALGNAAKAEDKSLASKLKPLVKALRDADKLIHEASFKLDAQGWTVENLMRTEQKTSSQIPPPDSLDQLIACAQTLTEDVRQTASFIQGNATLLFKRSITQSTAIGSNNNNNNNEWLEDYDYVSLESKEVAAKKNAEIRDALPHDLQKKFDNVIRNAETAANCVDKAEMDPTDKSLLVYYASQTVTHMGYLTQAIDAFLQTVEHNQPPKFFLAYGKFVVLSAHNLVNIGDIVHRNVTRQDVKTRIHQCSDTLFEALKTSVAKTKKAAQHFPSVTAVQEMVDSVVDISHLASDLKVAMLQAVSQ